MDEEEAVFDYESRYTEEEIKYLKEETFYDPITEYGQTFTHYHFPPILKKANIFQNILKKNVYYDDRA